MTTDLNALRDTLRARADAYTDAGEILARVGPAYRRRRARRRAGAGALALAVSALLVMVAPRLVTGGGGYAVPGPPAEAVAGPVGSDPLAVHFDVGEFPYPVRSTEWAVLDGVERLTVWSNTAGTGGRDDTAFVAELSLAADDGSPAPSSTALPVAGPGNTTAATVGERPGIVEADAGRTARVAWAPVTGVRAELLLRGPASVPAEKALAFAGTLRLDRGHRCELLVHPTVLPEGARVTGCSSMGDSRRGQLVVRGSGGALTVSVAGGVFAAGPPAATLPTLANGWPYQELEPSSGAEPQTAVIRVPDPYLWISAQGGYGRAELLLVAGGLQRS
ncbi:hypothetical protein [Dactylosporangium sp. CA-233914]|uniref:hypothetical protein n=1 Tax=Dactylosporangium sp. CA-233914 TaxID=3239934 RepID=UPI003D93FD63